MPRVPAAGGLPWVRRAIVVLVAGGLLWVGAPAPAAPEAGLTPDWGGGTLTVRGEGFRAAERVTLVATVGQAQQTFTVDADGAGRFALRTGLRVPAGGGVKLDARGDQGTAMAAIASGPAQRPRGRGTSVALVLAVTALAGLGFLGWRARARRSGPLGGLVGLGGARDAALGPAAPTAGAREARGPRPGRPPAPPRTRG